MRQRERVRRIENGKLGKDFRAEDVPDLEFLRVIGDDGTAVHFAPRADHGKNARDGNDRAGRLLEADEVLVPRILAAIDGDGDRLGIVADGTAAHGENEVRLACPRAFDALVQFFHRGIGHDARILRNGLAALLQNSDDLIVNTVLFDGTAAVDEHHVLTVAGKLFLQIFQRTLPEIQFCRIAIGKIPEHFLLLFAASFRIATT